MDIITVEWFGMQIMRPNNLITNLVVGVVGVCLFIWLGKKNTGKDPYLTHWQWFFLLVGLGGATGGVAHALNYDFPQLRHTYIHKVAWTLGGIGLFLGERACISFLPNKSVRSILFKVVFVKLICYIFLLYYSQLYLKDVFNHFFIVVTNTALAMLGVIFSTHVYSYLKNNNPGSIYVMAGILPLLLTVVLYVNKISLSIWFDFNDISHLLEIFCIVMVYLGVIKGYPYIESSLTYKRPLTT